MSWIKINEDTYRYEDGTVRFFLLLGKEVALLIDTGMNVTGIKELVREITDKPVSLCNTHADPDHIGGNREFKKVIISPAELVNCQLAYSSADIIGAYDGDIFDLGDRPLQIIEMPGHTPGSIALLDKNSGMLFSGDPIQDGHIFMFGPMRDLTAYIHSLSRLKMFESEIKEIYPSHGTCPLDFSIVNKLIEGAIRVEAGSITPTEAELFGQKIQVYDIGVAKILYE
ncbi:MAG: MBL fold metallo-hydrolase [Lachnospiraceae bacterium]|nr:MBL fold metallo-hydrolase [Lachnospiraceae bacterium]